MQYNLLKKIENGMPSFSKGQRAIAAYILEHYEKAAYMTAASLGEATGLSESTVVRFAAELGFDGYHQMQKALREAVKIKLTTVQRVELTNSIIGEGDLLSTILNADSEKIKLTLSEMDTEAFEHAVDKILAAKHIYIIGVRSSAFLAGFLNYNFRMIFDNVSFIQTTSGSEMFEQIINISEGDVMIAISFPRYSKRIIKAVEFAKKNSANVIALTDSEASPIAQWADQLLIARSDMASFVDSLVAPLSIVNAMIVAVARKRRDELTERLKTLEKIWDEYDVYDKNHE